MNEVIIPLGAGLIISVAGYIYNANKIERWMKSKRIDKTTKKDPFQCGVCGSTMTIRKRYSGKDAGKENLVCSRYPDCRKVEWNN